MDKIKVIFDTDIGDDIDDAFALGLALNLPEIDIVAVTTVFKNTAMRAKIASYQLNLNGRSDIPVYAGINKPLVDEIRKWKYEEYGESGLVRIKHFLPEMQGETFEQEDAVSAIIRLLRAHPHELTLLAIGPLTNLAAVYQTDPEAFRMAKGIMMMGGDAEGKYPEWNINVDPHAAAIVFASGVPIRSVGINVTRKCVVSDEMLAYFRSLKEPRNKLVTNMMEIWLKSQEPPRNPMLHDPLAVASLVRDFCEFSSHGYRIPVEGPERARTLPVDDEGLPEASLADTVDVPSFMQFMQQHFTD